MSQVTLATISKGAGPAGYTVQLQYVITLTAAALSCAVVTTNIGNSAISLHGSLRTSVAVNFVDGVYALGLQGCKFLSTAPPNSAPGLLSLNRESSIGKDAKVEGLLSRFKWFSGIGNDKKDDSSVESEGDLIVEKEDMVRLKGGFDRFYPVSPDCMPLLDRVSANHLRFVCLQTRRVIKQF